MGTFELSAGLAMVTVPANAAEHAARRQSVAVISGLLPESVLSPISF